MKVGFECFRDKRLYRDTWCFHMSRKGYVQTLLFQGIKSQPVDKSSPPFTPFPLPAPHSQKALQKGSEVSNGSGIATNISLYFFLMTDKGHIVYGQ